MNSPLPQRVLIVSYCPQPPLAEPLAAAFSRLGADTRIFHSWPCNTWYDRVVIHTVNHVAHNLRLTPKSVNLFEGHPKSHKEWRTGQLLRLYHEFRPDLVLITGVQRFKPEALAELHRGATVFFWFTESEQRFGEIAAELPYYHHLYVMSSACLEAAQQHGRNDATLLQHAVDTALYRPLELPQVYDWCFVGQWHERRQQYVEALAQVSQNFVIYGSRWRKHNLLNPSLLLRIKGKGIWGEPLIELYNQTRVVVNISVWGDERGGGRGVNMRLLEVPACRACLLTDYSRDAARLLTPGREFVSAANLAQMQDRLTDLLANREKRAGIAAAGYARAAKVRTYDDLVHQICRDWADRPESKFHG
jgi:spore maturation protein CgeB